MGYSNDNERKITNVYNKNKKTHKHMVILNIVIPLPNLRSDFENHKNVYVIILE